MTSLDTPSQNLFSDPRTPVSGQEQLGITPPSYTAFPSPQQTSLLNSIPSVADFKSALDSEVEVDREVWDLVMDQNNWTDYTYYTIHVPVSRRNVLIAPSKHVDYERIEVPDRSEHLWPVLTSKKHTVRAIPSRFEEWMPPIQQFLEKSAEYFRPYENSVQRRLAASFVLFLIRILTMVASAVARIVTHNETYLLLMLAVVPLSLMMVWLDSWIETDLANGVKALKLCGKYEHCLLPPKIKVVLGPYGAYWKFVLSN